MNFCTERVESYKMNVNHFYEFTLRHFFEIFSKLLGSFPDVINENTKPPFTLIAI